MKKNTQKKFDDLCHRIARNLKKIRAGRGFTQMQLGELTGTHWRHIQKIEAGDLNTSLKTIARLATALSIDPCDLLSKKPAEEGVRS